LPAIFSKRFADTTRVGLWHKDVKPDNIIVDGRHLPSAHLVDFGLVTPLRSGMTLTTHGTEYFRDPELVRLALKGVKVHQVDGAKFDLYAAGAVLFSMIENSFPAHGGAQPGHQAVPRCAALIVRRAMTDYDKRYTSAAAMLADLEVVRRAADPFAVKPAELPSVRSRRGRGRPARADRRWSSRFTERVRRHVAIPQWRPRGRVGGHRCGIRSSGQTSGGRCRLRDARRSLTDPARAPLCTGAASCRKSPAAARHQLVVGAIRIRIPARWLFPRRSPKRPVARAAMTPMPRIHAAPADEPRRSAVEQLSAARGRARAARERAGQRSKARRTAGALGRSNSSGGLAVAMLLAVLVPAAQSPCCSSRVSRALSPHSPRLRSI
jgi:hypothetical protein